MPEYFDVVNEDDVVVEKRPREECIDRGLLHRAVVVFLKNRRGETYIQKRAGNVFFYPGYWSAFVTGHVSSGESYLQAAEREVKEELGIMCRLSVLGKFVSPKWKIGSRIEWEYITVFEGVAIDSTITLSRETEQGRFVSQAEFRRLVSTEPGIFTPDTLLALKYYPGLS